MVILERTRFDLFFQFTLGTTLHLDWRVYGVFNRYLDICFHILRHTCASHLAMSGASTLEIAAILGHITLVMVKRYSHLSVSATAKFLEKNSCSGSAPRILDLFGKFKENSLSRPRGPKLIPVGEFVEFPLKSLRAYTTLEFTIILLVDSDCIFI